MDHIVHVHGAANFFVFFDNHREYGAANLFSFFVW
jgi:hypothetical protein